MNASQIKMLSSPLESWGKRLGSITLVESPAWQLPVLPVAIGAHWTASPLGCSCVAGKQPAFWQFFKGIIRRVAKKTSDSMRTPALNFLHSRHHIGSDIAPASKLDCITGPERRTQEVSHA